MAVRMLCEQHAYGANLSAWTYALLYRQGALSCIGRCGTFPGWVRPAVCVWYKKAYQRFGAAADVAGIERAARATASARLGSILMTCSIWQVCVHYGFKSSQVKSSQSHTAHPARAGTGDYHFDGFGPTLKAITYTISIPIPIF